MTKDEALATIIRDLPKLSDEQTQSVVEYVGYLVSEKTFYEIASQEVRDGVEKGLEDLRAGRVVSHDDLMARMDAKMAAADK